MLALVFHGALLATLAINVSLDKPKRPEERPGQIMHATIVPIPPAQGSPQGQLPKPSVSEPQQSATEPEKPKVDDTAKQKAEELAQQVAAQKKAEAERQKAIALKKAEEAKKKAEEEAKKKAEAEAKKKAEEEAKKKAEEEARKLIEEEIRKAAEEEAKRQQAAEQQAQMSEQANNLEDELLGQINGSPVGEGLGAGTGSNDSLTYGAKVQQLIEQNWRIDPSMNGKRVVVTVTVDEAGMISNEKCEGDKSVCASAIATLHLIGMLPMPPKGCKDCNTIVITMTPKL